MIKIGIAYFTGGGHAGLIAAAVAQGASAVGGTQADLHAINGIDIRDGRWSSPAMLESLTACDVIVFGSPTYMGGPAAQFKAFADGTAFVWRARLWQGKLAAGFTTSGNPSGDKLNTLTYLNSLAGQHGMIWLNWDELPRQPDGINHLGSYTGLMGQNPLPPGSAAELSDPDLQSSRRFGRYIATTTSRLLRASSAEMALG